MNERLVSVPPSAQATPVEDPQIVEVLDLMNGEILQVKRLISSLRHDEAIIHRGVIREGLETNAPLYACAHCGVPVYLISQTDRRRFFFRHTLEDGRCDAHTRGRLSQKEIRERQYQGLREGAAHKRLKALIERSVASDPRFHDVAVERTWRSAHDPRQWRKPDVSAAYDPVGRIVFEGQISRTFLDVVVARRMFYRDQEALLVWVLASFEPEYRRLMIDDILFSNNSNVFVIDDETTRLSEERKALHLRCHFRQACREGFEVKEKWGEKIVAFADLRLDMDGWRAFHIDFMGEENRLRADIDAELRREFFDLFEADWPHDDPSSPFLARWAALKSLLSARNVPLPDHYPQHDSDFRALVVAVRSMELGYPIVWRHAKLVSVVHQITNDHKGHVVAMIEAIRLFGRRQLLLNEDPKNKGKWAAKRVELKKALDDFDQDYFPNTDWIPALRFLYPDIADAVAAYCSRFFETIE